jgi:hypothetical protein
MRSAKMVYVMLELVGWFVVGMGDRAYPERTAIFVV